MFQFSLERALFSSLCVAVNLSAGDRDGGLQNGPCRPKQVLVVRVSKTGRPSHDLYGFDAMHLQQSGIARLFLTS